MGEKDLTEKQLLELSDVFADVVNVLLFSGKETVLPKDLKPANKDSVYKDKNLKIHMQERDVAKLWIKQNIRLAFFGFENQTAIDYEMVLRIMSYDGAVYRTQLQERDENDKKIPPYPTITLVLHFDYEKHWTAPHTLKETFKNIPNGLEKYISDYKINVFEIAWLSDETIAKFKSDFRFIADYYSQMRKTGKWKPIPDKVKHLKELFDLLGTLTNDTRFIDMYYQKKGEADNMSSVALDYLESELAVKLESKLAVKVKDKIRAEGKDIAILDSIRNLMRTAKWTAQQAMDALLVPKEDRQRYLERI